MTLADRILARGEVPREFRFEEQHVREILIGGRVAWSGDTIPALSPVPLRRQDGAASFALLGSTPACGEVEARIALEAANEAWDAGDGPWPAMSLEERANVLYIFLDLLRPLRERIAQHIMWGVGKAYAEALNEFDRTLEYAADTIAAGMSLQQRMRGDVSLQNVTGYAELLPIGIALCVGPYNYPFYETLTNVIPALLTGNTVIIKSPPRGELLYGALLAIFDGLFPPGTVNMLFGESSEVLPALMRSGRVDVFAFIGTSRVADSLIAQHPYPHRLHCILGLEAKNAAIVLPDAPLELTVAEISKGALAFNGQRCAAIKLILAHAEVEERLLHALHEAIADMQPSMPWTNPRLTPVISGEHADYLDELLEDALYHDAVLVNAERPDRAMTLYPPALLSNTTADMRIVQEEQFGPIIPVLRVEEVDEALDLVKHARFGQQLSVFTSSADALHAITRRAVRYVGRININGKCQRGPDHFPFTGRKDSALATVSIEDALFRFSIATVTATPEMEQNLELWRQYSAAGRAVEDAESLADA